MSCLSSILGVEASGKDFSEKQSPVSWANLWAPNTRFTQILVFSSTNQTPQERSFFLMGKYFNLKVEWVLILEYREMYR